MAKKKEKVEATELSTEEKIKAAARIVFTQKGYAATRTRDIAEAAGINLALLNYYFRSKEKLFELVMLEKMGNFFGVVGPVVNDTTTSLDEKVEEITARYTELLEANPDLPLFILSEIRTSPAQFIQKIPVGKIIESHFFKQIKEKRPDLHPVHFFINIIGLNVFPFVMKPVIIHAGLLTEKTFQERATERKKLIPKWIGAMLKTK